MLREWMWCQLLEKLISWHAARLNPANPIIYHPFRGPTVAIETPPVSTATQGNDGKGEALYCSGGEDLAEKDGGLMKKIKLYSSVVLHFYILEQRELRAEHVQGKTAHRRKDKRWKWRSGYMRVGRKKQTGLLLPWHTTGWHYVPSQNVMWGDIEAVSRVSNNKGESFSGVWTTFLPKKNKKKIAVSGCNNLSVDGTNCM